MFYLWSLCFHSELKPLLADKLLPLIWLKSFGKIILTWGTPLELYSDWEIHFLTRCLDDFMLFGGFCNTFSVLTTLKSSDLVESIKVIIKTKLAKFVETIQIPWTKALLLVFLNLITIPFITHKLSAFDRAHPMHLFLASFEPHLIKGDIFHYWKGLMPSIKNTNALIEQSFHSVPLGDEDIKHRTCNLQILSSGKKNTSRRTLFNHVGKSPNRYC